MKQRTIFFLTGVCALLSGLHAPLFAQGGNPLNMILDFATFRYSDDQTYVEMYYGFRRSEVAYVKGAEGYTGSIVMSAGFSMDKESEAVASKRWNVPIRMADTAGMTSLFLTGKIEFLLEPGRYVFSYSWKDKNDNSRAGTGAFPIVIRKYAGNKPLLSDIELASSIRRIEKDTTNVFYKNTLEVVPNPTGIFGGENAMLEYYAEVYHVFQPKFSLRTEIVNTYGKTIYKKLKDRTGPKESILDIGSLSIETLPTGTYTLVLSIVDTVGNVAESQSKRFFVVNPHALVDSSSQTQTAREIAYEFASLNEEELDLRFAEAKYVASQDEKRTWDRLSGSEAKKKFLTRFWNDRDPEPGIPGNSAYDQYQERVAAATAQYRTAFTPGWKTARGRVFIMYGPPDNVERFPATEGKPYEIWYYDVLEGGVEFVFIDRGGFGSYELEHSTMKGELQNPDWKGLVGN